MSNDREFTLFIELFRFLSQITFIMLAFLLGKSWKGKG